MAESNLIQFKRGSLANLELLINQKKGIDGTFYLTVDDDATDGNTPSKSSRLFVGRADGSIVPVNQGIITVSAITDLTSNINSKWHAGDYAYVTGSNILAIYDGTNWKQINQVGTDTFIESFSTAITGTDGATKTITTSGTYNLTKPAATTSFAVTGDNGISVKSTGTTLTISGDPYELSADVVRDSNEATITLASDSDKAGSTNSGTVTLKAGTNVNITKDSNDKIVIGSKDIHVNGVAITGETNGFKVKINETEGIGAEGTFDPKIQYVSAVNENTGAETTATVGFQGSTMIADLPVYSKAVIDQKLKGIDALVYRGTIGQGSGSASQTGLTGITSASNGDTFKAVTALTIPAANSATGSEISVAVGDVLIAQGTEGTDGKISGTIKYDVIPSGNEDTQYEFINTANGIKLHPNAGVDQGAIVINPAQNSLITVNDNWNNTTKTKTITLDHATVTRTDPTAITGDTQVAGQSKDVTYVSEITSDNYGHITGVQLKTTTLLDTNAELGTLTNSVTSGSVANTTTTYATVTTAASLSHVGSGYLDDSKSTAFDLASDNMAVSSTAGSTGVNPQVKMNFVWGTF